MFFRAPLRQRIFCAPPSANTLLWCQAWNSGLHMMESDTVHFSDDAYHSSDL